MELSSVLKGVNNADSINLFPANPVFWTNSVHGLPGHLLRTDGSVVRLNSDTLAADYRRLLDEAGNFHYLRAR